MGEKKKNRLSKGNPQTLNRAAAAAAASVSLQQQQQIQLVKMDSMTVCPRCYHQRYLIYGLLKTPAVCIDCAVDQSWTNPQENFPREGLKVPKLHELEGRVGPFRVIVNHPTYSIIEKISGDKDILICNNNWSRMFKVPRFNKQSFDSHAAKNQLPIVTLTNSQIEKPSMQHLSRINGMNIMQDRITELAKQNNIDQSHTVITPLTSKQQPLYPLLTAMLQGNSQENHVNVLQNFVGQSKIPQWPQEARKKEVNNPPPYDRNWTDNPEIEAMIRNVQRTQSSMNALFAEHTNSPQIMIGNARNVLQQENANQMSNTKQTGKEHIPSLLYCVSGNHRVPNGEHMLSDCCEKSYDTNWQYTQNISQIQNEAMAVAEQHARLTEVGNLKETFGPPERVTYGPFEFTIQENVYHTKFNKLHEDNVSRWHQNQKCGCEFDGYNACPTLMTSGKHDTSTSADIWPCNFTTHNNIPTDEERAIMLYNKHPFKTLPVYALPGQIEPTTVKSTNRTWKTATQKNQMHTRIISNQNTDDWPSTCIYGSEPVSPKQLPQCAASSEQARSPREALDLICKTAAKENHNQMEPKKLSNQEVGVLYPYSIFNSNMADPKSQSTHTEQRNPTEEATVLSCKNSAKEKCAEMHLETIGNQQMCNPSDIFSLADPKSLVTTKEQVQLTNDETVMASNIIPIENQEKIELEKKGNQQITNVCDLDGIMNSANIEATPVSSEQVMSKEEVIGKTIRTEAIESCIQIQNVKSIKKEDDLLQPCKHKPDILPKLTQFLDEAKPHTASKKNEFEEASKSTNTNRIPFVKNSVMRLKTFETVEDFQNAFRAGMFEAHNTVLSTKPMAQMTTEGTLEKYSKDDSTACGSHHPKMPNLKLIHPDKQKRKVEAASLQKGKFKKTAADQANCARTQIENRVGLKGQVSHKSEERFVQNNTDKLKSAMEKERRNLKAQKLILKQLKKLLAWPPLDEKCAEEVIAMEAPQSNPNCQKKESEIPNTSSSNIYKDGEAKTETTKHQEVKRTLKMESEVCPKRSREERTDLATPQNEEKKPTLKQKDKKNFTDESHEFERSRLTTEQPIKKIVSDQIEENIIMIQKVESLANTRKTTGSGTLLSEKQAENKESKKNPKKVTDPTTISKEIKVKTNDVARASKPVYVHGNQQTDDKMEKTKENEHVFGHERSLKSTEPLPVEQDFEKKLGRKRHYNEIDSFESSKDDMTSFKNSFEDQEVETAAKSSRTEEPNMKKIRNGNGEMVKGVQHMAKKDLKRQNIQQPQKTASTNRPKVAQTTIAKPKSDSKKERKEEQPNHTPPYSAAMHENKSKVSGHKHQGEGSTLEAEVRKSLPKSAKDQHELKKVKSTNPLPEKASNFSKSESVEMRSSEGETRKKQIITHKKKKKQNTPIHESRSESSNDNGHSKTHKTISDSKKTKKRPFKSIQECEIEWGPSQDSSNERIPKKDRKARRTQSSKIRQNRKIQKDFKEVDYTNDDYIAMCLSIDKSIEEETIQYKEGCTSTVQIKINEIITKIPTPQDQERKREISNGNDRSKVQRKMQHQDSKKESHPNIGRRANFENKKHPNQNVMRHIHQNQEDNIDIYKHRAQKIQPSTSQRQYKPHSEKVYGPKPRSQSATSSSNIPQHSRQLGSIRLKKKQSAICSRDQLTHLVRPDIKTDVPRIPNQKRELEINDKSQGPDHAMPRNTAHRKERHPKPEKRVRFQNQDDQSDARNNIENGKEHRKIPPTETFQDHQSSDSCQDCDEYQETKDTQRQAIMQQEGQNPSPEMHQTSLFNHQTLSHDRELQEGKVKEKAMGIEIHVFDKQLQKISPQSKDDRLDNWSAIEIKTVPINRPSSMSKYPEWRKLTNTLLGCANPNLFFREWKKNICSDTIRKSVCLTPFDLIFQNKLVSFYAYAFMLWAAVKERSDSPTLQRKKYFIANLEQEAVNYAQKDHGFEKTNAKENDGDMNLNEEENIEQYHEPSQRQTVKTSNEEENNERYYELLQRQTIKYSNEEGNKQCHEQSQKQTAKYSKEGENYERHEQSQRQRTKDPQRQARMERNGQNASPEMHQASLSSPLTSSHDQELKEGKVKEKAMGIEIRVFDKYLQKIGPQSKDDRLDNWSEIEIKTVPINKQSMDKYAEWRKLTNTLLGCANPNLFFKEWKNICSDTIRKSVCLTPFDLMFKNKLVSFYAYAFVLWVCVKERSDSPTLQRKKYFIANLEQDAVNYTGKDGGFEIKNARESYGDTKLHEEENNDRYHEQLQRQGAKFANNVESKHYYEQLQIQTTKYKVEKNYKQYYKQSQRHTEKYTNKEEYYKRYGQSQRQTTKYTNKEENNEQYYDQSQRQREKFCSEEENYQQYHEQSQRHTEKHTSEGEYYERYEQSQRQRAKYNHQEEYYERYYEQSQRHAERYTNEGGNYERYEQSQRQTAQYSNQFPRTRREYWDWKSRRFRKPPFLQERGFRRESYHPTRQYEPCDNFSGD